MRKSEAKTLREKWRRGGGGVGVSFISGHIFSFPVYYHPFCLLQPTTKLCYTADNDDEHGKGSKLN